MSESSGSESSSALLEQVEAGEGLSRKALWVLCASLGLGVAGNMLLNAPGLGVNVPLWTALLIGVIFAFDRLSTVRVTPVRRVFFVLAFVFSCGFAWRAAPALRLLDVAALFVCLVFALFSGLDSGLRWTRLTLIDLFTSTQGLVSTLISGPPLIVGRNIVWVDVEDAMKRWRPTPLVVGILISIPLLVVFGALLSAADVIFEKLVLDLWRYLPEISLRGLLFTAICAWVACGLLRAHLLPSDSTRHGLAIPANFAPTLGLTQILIPLITMNLLFSTFIWIQIRYLFGGDALIQATAHLTYSAYARQGFFQLLLVVMLALPLLMGAEWLLRDESPSGKALFRVLAWIMVALLCVVVASALQRMRIYTNAYGLTQLRLYATAFILWLAVQVLWFGLTALTGRRSRFLSGTLVTGLAAIIVLHAVNPDAIIVQTNVGLAMKTQRPLHDAYLGQLSLDAVPALENIAVTAASPDLASQLSSVKHSICAEYSDDWRAAVLWPWGVK